MGAIQDAQGFLFADEIPCQRLAGTALGGGAISWMVVDLDVVMTGKTGLVALLAACAFALVGCGGGAGGSDDGGAPAGNASVTLTWTAPSDARISGYRVYYGLSSRSYLQARGSGLNSGNSTRFAVSGLEQGRDYYFAVTAYDAAGNESEYSSEVTKQVQ